MRAETEFAKVLKDIKNDIKLRKAIVTAVNGTTGFASVRFGGVSEPVHPQELPVVGPAVSVGNRVWVLTKGAISLVLGAE